MLPHRLTDMCKMIEDLFFRYPHLCRYLPGRKGALFQQGYDRLPDIRVLFAGNKITFCIHFLYFLGKIYYIINAVELLISVQLKECDYTDPEQWEAPGSSFNDTDFRNG